MMGIERIRDLQIKKLISEYDFLLADEEWKMNIIEDNKCDFLKEINSVEGVSISEEEVPENKNQKKNFEVDDSSKSKFKKIYYEIAKITHPDKTKDPELNEIYEKSSKFYEENNILELYRIANLLHIKIEIEEENLENFKKIIGDKKNYLKSLESSWLWLWINCSTREEKDNIVNLFLKKNSNI